MDDDVALCANDMWQSILEFSNGQIKQIHVMCGTGRRNPSGSDDVSLSIVDDMV